MGVTIGTLSVRRSTLINATPARVWQEFATEQKIKTWFGQGHTLHTFIPSRRSSAARST